MKKVLLLLVFAFASIFLAEAQTTYYVSTDVTSNDANAGTSWLTAFRTVQKALSVATNGDEIWVAAGVYYPDEGLSVLPSDPRDATFQLKSGVKLYGGFAGSEAPTFDLSLRNFVINETILSGDIDQDGPQQPVVNNPLGDTDYFSNVYHVVTSLNVDNTATFDGFTITAGSAWGVFNPQPDLIGAGMYNNGSSLVISNCKFAGNYAQGSGGGMYNDNSPLTIMNCTFINNNTSGGGGQQFGAAIYNRSSTVPITDCSFLNNVAEGAGAITYDDSGSPTITRCTFTNNEATITSGGAVFNFTTTAKFVKCIFSGNKATSSNGGAVNVSDATTFEECMFSNNTADRNGGAIFYGSSSSTLMEFIDCEFTENKAGEDGGGIAMFGGSVTITDCMFTGNESMTRSGGGIFSDSNSSLEVTGSTFSQNEAAANGGGISSNQITALMVDDCTFSENEATNGAGLSLGSGNQPTVTNCTFSMNDAFGGGGGIVSFNENNPSILNCSFFGNEASGGGAFSNSSSSPNIINCIFSGNNGTNSGGAISNSNSSPNIINCSITGNKSIFGGGFENRNNSSPIITNCIVWNNQSGGAINPSIYNQNTSSNPVISNTIIPFDCGWDTELGTDGGNNLNVDPLFVTPVDPATAPTTSGDLRLMTTSPAINRGDNSVVTVPPFPDDGSSNPIDLDGNARIQVTTVDMGAYEENTGATLNPIVGGASIIYVDADANPGGDGTSWATAYNNLQDALVKACGATCPGDIWVANGIYYPSQNSTNTSSGATDRTNTFQLCNNVGIYGGFSGWSGGFSGGSDETMLSQRNVTANITILSGDLNRDDGQRPIVTDPSTNTNISDNAYTVVTGSFTDDTAILDGFTITAGHANVNTTLNNPTREGAGMYNDNGSPTIAHCTFTGNLAIFDGGGISNFRSSPSITDCIFSNNIATENSGGGIANFEGSIVVANCMFLNNRAGSVGGAIDNGRCISMITDCTFFGNISGNGGAIYQSEASIDVLHCTFEQNVADNVGGGIFNISNTSPSSFINCTFVGNMAQGGGGLHIELSSSTTTVANCIFTGNEATDIGGAFTININPIDIINCTFSGNKAANRGGAIFNVISSSNITNSIIWNNQAGGVIDDANASIFNLAGGTPLISHTIIPFECTWNPLLGINGGNNNSIDPEFITPVDPATAPTTAGNVRLMTISPAINRGNNSVVTVPPFPDDGSSNPIDLDGNARIQVTTVDRGAYEENTGATTNPIVSNLPVKPAVDVTLATCDATGQIAFTGSLGTNEAYFFSTNGGFTFEELMTATITLPQGPANAITYQIKTVNSVTGCESELEVVNIEAVICPGTITIVKEVVEGSTESEFDFEIDLGNSVSDFVLTDGQDRTFDELAPGDYVINETFPVGESDDWEALEANDIVCVSENGNSTFEFLPFADEDDTFGTRVTLASGDNVTCTFMNTEKPDCVIPTLGGVSIANICTGKKATVTLTGLIPEMTFEVTYTLGSDDPETVIVTSNANGEATFETRVVSFADDNGAILTITLIDYEEDANTCPNDDLSNNTATLNVLNVDCGEFPWRGGE